MNDTAALALIGLVALGAFGAAFAVSERRRKREAAAHAEEIKKLHTTVSQAVAVAQRDAGSRPAEFAAHVIDGSTGKMTAVCRTCLGLKVDPAHMPFDAINRSTPEQRSLIAQSHPCPDCGGDGTTGVVREGEPDEVI